MRYFAYFFVLALTFIGCTPPTQTAKPTTTPISCNGTNTKSINVDETTVTSLGKGECVDADIYINGQPKDLYVLLSNYSSTTIDTSSEVFHSKQIASSISKLLLQHKELAESPLKHSSKNRDFLTSFQEHNTSTISPTRQQKSFPTKQKSVVGDTFNFCTDVNDNSSYSCARYSQATARSTINRVSTSYGSKSLVVWVSNDSFSGSGCTKSSCVTQEMVDFLAQSFLKSGSDNDIYDWDTSLYGEEWGSDTNGISGLINADDTIHILVTDIDNDNRTDGGVIGFFWAKDNYTKSEVAGSNEKIMFYIDSILFSQKDGITWESTDFFPRELISTLAHEFVHMIQFYQRDVLLLSPSQRNETKTWIYEMMAEATEDLVATKIKHTGSRGVTYTDGGAGDSLNTEGRYPAFNDTNTYSLTDWLGHVENYSHVNAFGAFLTRNYGGAKVLHDMMYSPYINEQCVVNAVNQSAQGGDKTFDDLLSEWGVAVMLSDIESPNNLPTYNTGDFTSTTYNAITYQLGSVNFFNYFPAPSIYTTLNDVNPQANYYYKVGSNLSGYININLKLSTDTEATLIAK